MMQGFSNLLGLFQVIMVNPVAQKHPVASRNHFCAEPRGTLQGDTRFEQLSSTRIEGVEGCLLVSFKTFVRRVFLLRARDVHGLFAVAR